MKRRQIITLLLLQLLLAYKDYQVCIDTSSYFLGFLDKYYILL